MSNEIMHGECWYTVGAGITEELWGEHYVPSIAFSLSFLTELHFGPVISSPQLRKLRLRELKCNF